MHALDNCVGVYNEIVAGCFCWIAAAREIERAGLASALKIPRDSVLSGCMAFDPYAVIPGGKPRPDP